MHKGYLATKSQNSRPVMNRAIYFLSHSPRLSESDTFHLAPSYCTFQILQRANLVTLASHLLLLNQVVAVDTDHRLTQVLGNLSENLGVVEVGDSLDDSLGTLSRVTGLEDTGSNEDTVTAELHHHGSISGGSDTTSSEVDNRQSLEASSLLEKVVWDLQVLGEDEELIVRGGGSLADVGGDLAHVTDSLDNVTGTGLTLGSDHSSTLGDATESLTQVTGTTDERNLVVKLVDVVDVVGHGQDLGLVDEVDADGLKNLSLNEVTDADLSHDGDGDGLDDLLDHLGVGHTGNTTVPADVSRDTLEGHDGTSTGLLSDTGLLGASAPTHLITSMMTPPFNICAKPDLTAKEPATGVWAPEPLTCCSADIFGYTGSEGNGRTQGSLVWGSIEQKYIASVARYRLCPVRADPEDLVIFGRIASGV
ncbi:hypothetical protein G7K_4268-t1 [Saitoella complicata NRRL Y-17804]|uniref:Uncharacterized protein n=1 Tax=Saitoella complicata (strain BCRC 22490 / CBS 7301 / JCM 7358 / NBRC 10748 / NRRL Y-17804) TaxID=698492 RepID=A0A0E9NK00_SAICN|nr:hypothetical protein G7K_4268-t1 [Saitoella complicata NRRL Y-17804]